MVDWALGVQYWHVPKVVPASFVGKIFWNIVIPY